MKIQLNRILLVEDNENDLELTIDAIKKNNLANELDIARDGSEALDYLFYKGKWKSRESGNPAVILLDLKLPKVSGMEVLKKIRETDQTKMIPVVILTSSNEEKDIIEGYRLGTNAYVVKPVVFNEFIEAVKLVGAFWGIINKPPLKT
ncbi:MAG: response regulator [Bacteroidales bacterium]|nr:response regulator [Bacteroidales bacterium]